jgi:translation initiation factor 4G
MPNPVHAPHPPPAISLATNSISGLTSPPPTPSSNSTPSNRLNAGSSAFVPRSSAKVTLKKEDGTEVNIENLKSNPPPVVSNTGTPSSQGSVYRQGSPGTPNRRPASIRIESEDQRKLRLAQEEEKEQKQARLKAEAEEKVKKEKEEAERKVKEAEEKKRKQEEAEKEHIRKEEEKKEMERLRLEEEERIRKEAEEREAKRVKEEEERKRRVEAEAEAKRVAEEEARKEEQRLEKERLEKERLEKERLEKEKEEKERLAKVAEAEAERLRLEQEEAAQEEAAKKAVPEPEAQPDGKAEAVSEDGELVDDGKDIEAPAPSKDEGKEKLKEGLRINTAATSPPIDRRRPGPLDLSHAKSNNVVASPLATARVISDINTIQYPEGVLSPRADLNENAKEGKFRSVYFFSACLQNFNWKNLQIRPTVPSPIHGSLQGKAR